MLEQKITRTQSIPFWRDLIDFFIETLAELIFDSIEHVETIELIKPVEPMEPLEQGGIFPGIWGYNLPRNLEGSHEILCILRFTGNTLPLDRKFLLQEGISCREVMYLIKA